MSLILNILKYAIDQDASYVHLVYNAKPFIRINGENSEIDYLDLLTSDDTLSFFEELLAYVKTENTKDKIIEQYKSQQDTTFAIQLEPEIRCRINIHQQNMAPALAIKIIKQILPTPEQLNLSSIIYELCELERGLILITGPSGNGKTTTMASMINIMNRNQKKHILTIENPTEFKQNSISSFIEQREIGQDTPSYSVAITNALKQDIDVIFIGEIDSAETVENALIAAESGHLVVAAINTLDSYKTIDRIISMFPEWNQKKIRNQLANVLITIISQRLIPSLDAKRLITTEILKNNYSIKNSIREGSLDQINHIIETSESEGMHLYSQDLIKLVRGQLISFQTAIKYCDEKNYFEKIAQEMLKES